MTVSIIILCDKTFEYVTNLSNLYHGTIIRLKRSENPQKFVKLLITITKELVYIQNCLILVDLKLYEKIFFFINIIICPI